MFQWWICTHCSHGHTGCCCIYMTPMWHHRVFNVSNRQFPFSPDLLFCAFLLKSFIFLKEPSHHDSNDEWILLVDMKNSRPHMNVYCEEIFLSWGGIIDRSVEPLMMILFSTSLDPLSPPTFGGTHHDIMKFPDSHLQ